MATLRPHPLRSTTRLRRAARAATGIAFASAAASTLISPAVAQQASGDAAQPNVSTQLAPVTVSGRTTPVLDVGGWGDTPLNRTPLQASVFASEQLKDAGAQRLSDLIRFDPAVSDAYDAEGYYDILTVRGFVIDNRFNYRRDGLPINAETALPLDNKSRIEVLKGTSGMQAGTSTPGGLVNLVVKRPTDAPLRSASLEWRQAGSVTGAVDIGQRFGEGQAFGVRLNAAAAHLDPKTRDARGNRSLFALAADWRLGTSTLLEAEFETSHRAQPTVPGFSLLGNRVPDPVDPRINLNNQPWSQPTVFDANTASLRWRQRLGSDWSFTAHLATQRLRTDDRVAFPFGCTTPDGGYYPDRYCPDGSFDLYDFRSENERRRSEALDVSIHGRLATGPVGHAITAGGLRSKVHNSLQGQAYNYVGSGNVDGTAVTPPDAALAFPNTDRDERSTELYLRDALTLNGDATAWLGLRHTRLSRSSIGTDGSQPIRYDQSFTTPFVALSHRLGADGLVYASWGRGVESAVAPDLPIYLNHGQALPALRSRQAEIGFKGSNEALEWNVAAFDITRPLAVDVGSCRGPASCTRAIDGEQHHRGVEGALAVRSGAWLLQAGGQWLRARVEGSSVAASNGLEPVNVPPWTIKAQAHYTVPALHGLSLSALVSHESRRMVLPDNSARIPGVTRTGVAARYETRAAGGVVTTWRIGIDNLFDRRSWRESPYQFAHAYLFPLAPRTVRASVQLDL
jgi:iron complex outermembrane recepter protein